MPRTSNTSGGTVWIPLEEAAELTGLTKTGVLVRRQREHHAYVSRGAGKKTEIALWSLEPKYQAAYYVQRTDAPIVWLYNKAHSMDVSAFRVRGEFRHDTFYEVECQDTWPFIGRSGLGCINEITRIRSPYLGKPTTEKVL
jgi:hypothetical protein